MISTSLHRADAVKQLSNYVADRDAFLVSVSLRLFGAYAYAFSSGAVGSWAVYVDLGGQTVLRTSDPALLAALTRSEPGTAVLVIPKTVPAAVVGQVFQQQIPVDGSRDLLDLDLDYQPSLIFEAMDLVDPAEGAAMRAAMHAGRPKLAAL
jgi:hypothetical protein